MTKSAPAPNAPPPQHSHPWEARYLSGDTRWDKGVPAPGLIEFLQARPELPRGSVAVPGCGSGHDARAWCDFGFNARGFDIAPGAIRLALQRTEAWRTTAPAGTPAPSFSLCDFLRDNPPFRFDYVFEHTLFCAIQPAERGAYVEALLRWLKPRGDYLAVNYIVCDGKPPFPVSRAELWARFRPRFHLIDQWVPRSYHNRAGRELMCWWRRK